MAKKKINYGKKDLLGPEEFSAKTAKERITIWVPEKVVDQFRKRAESEGTKYQTLVNQALKEFLKKPSLVKRVERLEKKLASEA